jgi:hypothetical protein
MNRSTLIIVETLLVAGAFAGFQRAPVRAAPTQAVQSPAVREAVSQRPNAPPRQPAPSCTDPAPFRSVCLSR